MLTSYRLIPSWENRRRLQALASFRELVVGYFKGVRVVDRGFDPAESQNAQIHRTTINRKLCEIAEIVTAAGVNSGIVLSANPYRGGYNGSADLIAEVFNLIRLEVPADRLVDCLDRAIGVYEMDSAAAQRRTLNPFWWAWRAFLVVANVPAQLLGAVGFDASRFDSSTPGRITKLVTLTAALATTVWGMIQILDRAGVLPPPPWANIDAGEPLRDEGEARPQPSAVDVLDQP